MDHHNDTINSNFFNFKYFSFIMAIKDFSPNFDYSYFIDYFETVTEQARINSNLAYFSAY